MCNSFFAFRNVIAIWILILNYAIFHGLKLTDLITWIRSNLRTSASFIAVLSNDSLEGNDRSRYLSKLQVPHRRSCKYTRTTESWSHLRIASSMKASKPRAMYCGPKVRHRALNSDGPFFFFSSTGPVHSGDFLNVDCSLPHVLRGNGKLSFSASYQTQYTALFHPHAPVSQGN
jgi:hypothetical protein